MNITKLLVGTIAGGIVFFLLGWLVYGQLLASFMYHNTGKAGHIINRKDMEFLYLVIGNLLSGLLLAYIFLKGNVNTLAAGLVTGGIVGFLMAASVDSVIYGTSFVLSKKAMVADVLAYTVISAVAGAVIAAVSGGKGSRSGG